VSTASHPPLGLTLGALAQEISILTKIPLRQLRLLATHLVYWRHAKIICTITSQSVYAVSSSALVSCPLSHPHGRPPLQLNPAATTHRTSLKVMEFQQRFSKESLFQVGVGGGAAACRRVCLS
jgi:hypothetical protein